MNIPFIETVGIQKGMLTNNESVQNHLGSIHAGAQFTFAEAASGKYLSSLVPELQGKIVPLLRESSIKYKKQAFSTLRSEVTIEEEALKDFLAKFEAKGRASIVAKVTLYDEENDVTCVGSFKWFVQKID